MSSKTVVKKDEVKTNVLSLKEHIKKQPMWAGRKKKASEICYILDNELNKFVRSQENYSPALLKICDEIIVNAIDHSIQNPTTVKNIKINFDESTGKITIENDGPGIPVYVAALIGDPVDKLQIKEYSNMEEVDKDIPNLYRAKWNPQILVEHPFSGSNYKDTSKEIHVCGGTNGIGMKIVNYYSTWFKIDTIDKYRKLHYSQTFEDGTDIINKPIIKKTKKEPMTRISFIPAYKHLGGKLKDDDINLLYKLIETRSYQASVYASANIYFQDEIIEVSSLLDLVKMHIPEIKTMESDDDHLRVTTVDESEFIYYTKIKPVNRPAMDPDKFKKLSSKVKKKLRSIDWDWDLCITPNMGTGKSERYSIMNGVFIQSGAHINYIEKLLIDSLRSKVEKFTKDSSKRWSDSYLTNNMNIFIKGAIDCPSFDSQSKSNLKEQFNKFECYKLKAKDIRNIWELLESHVLSYAIDKFDKSQNKNKVKLGDIPKYKPALNAGKKCKEERCLFIPEGDSLASSTPLLLKKENKIYIKTIDDISTDWVDVNDRQHSTTDFQVWSDNGWTDIKYVMKHKVSKRMYRVLTHTGYCEITEDHSLLNESGVEITPKDCNVGDKLLHSFPHFEENRIEIPDNLEELHIYKIYEIAKRAKIPYTKRSRKQVLINKLKKIKNIYHIDLTDEKDIVQPDEAYVFGLFWSDGCANIYHKDGNRGGWDIYYWVLDNTNLKYLEKSKKILEKYYNYKFKIISQKKKLPRYKQQYRLKIYGGKTIKSFVRKYTESFYDKDRYKCVPPFILNASREVRQQFFNGYYDGDGSKTKTDSERFDILGQIGAQGLYYLCKSIGYGVSINCRTDKPNVYRLNLTRNNAHQQFDPIKIKKIIDLGTTEQYVYDLETENHHFNAGIGSITVHNSAASLIDKGLSKRLFGWDRKNNGIFNIQGVPMNARRFVKVIHDRVSGETRKLPLRRLSDNERLSSLMRATGLDYRKTYKTLEEFKTLRYDCIIATVDADPDGKGCIFTLILSFISLFWPHLINRKFVKRLNTPIIRAFSKTSKKGKIICKSFYTIPEYKEWEGEEFGSPEDVSKKWTIEYFKGLAATSEDAVSDIFKHMNDRTFIYRITKYSEGYFEIYLGKDSNKRKKELKTPDLYKIPPGKLIIDCEEHLRSDGKEFQRYNIQRSLPHSIDGLCPSRRKILCAGRKFFGARTTSEKVATFGGEVVKTMSYHHGEASLANTITKMGQEFFGTNVLPLFRGNSVCVGFGSRKTGGTDLGAPRYIKIKLNKYLTNLIFSSDDDYLLPYIFDDGVRCEPAYYVPIIPMAIIENINLPAHGWQVCSWGRDLEDVMSNVRSLITGESKKIEPMNINTYGWEGDMCEYEFGEVKKIFSVGKYKYNKVKNIINITELPHRIFSEPLIEGNRKKEAKKKEHCDIDDDFKRFVKEISNKTCPKKKKTRKEKSKSNIIAGGNYGKEYEELENEIYQDSETESENEENASTSQKSKNTRKYTSYTIKDKPVVKSVIDESNNDKIDITIRLKEHGYEYIKHKCSNSIWDPIIEYFHLRRIIYDNLNFLKINGEVKTYKTYESLMMDWYKERKRLYTIRVDRKIIILKLQIELRMVKNRFSAAFDGYNLGKKSKIKWSKKLEDNNYIKYNESIIINPKYTPIDKIIYFAKEDPEGISYDYIYSLRQTDIMNESIIKREEEIKKLGKELTALTNKWKNFKGDRLWLSELDELEKIIKKGITLGWGYNEGTIVYE